MRQRRPLLILLLMALAALPFLSAILVVVIMLRGPYQSKKDLRAEGDAIVRGLNEYKRQHGRYPASLAEAWLTPTVTAYGPWEYSKGPLDGFSLSVGDYGRDGFCLSITAGRGWYLDE
jgi:hypothetical protein